MPQTEQKTDHNKKPQDLTDMAAMQERLSDIDTRFEQLEAVVENLMIVQQQLVVALDKNASIKPASSSRSRSGSGSGALTGAPSQEQLGQNLSCYVLAQINNL